MKKVVLSIDGMTCSACSNGLEKYLNKQPGIKSAVVNLVMNNASIEYDDKKLTLKDLDNFVLKAGFKSLGIDNFEKEEKKKTNEKYKLIGITFFALLDLYVSMSHMIKLPVIPFLHMENYPLNYAISLFILTFLVIILGFDILKNGIKNLIHKTPNMDTLVTLGVLSSFLYSIFGTFMILRGDASYVHNLYFESASTVIFFIKIGKFIEAKNKDKTKEALKALMTITPKNALIEKDGTEITVTIDEIKKGDIVICKPGEKIAVDGTIIEGSTHINESFITGESIPVKREIGSKVIAGRIKYKAEKIGKESTVSEIVRMVVEATNTKAPIAKIADTISSYFVPVIIVIAVLSFITWFIISKNFSTSINIFVSILVVACPCSLGLATPLAIVISSGLCSKKGILVKTSEALENAHKLKTIVFDKTGTLTQGKLTVSKIFNYSELSVDNILQIAASIENKSEHPIARAIVNAAQEKKLQFLNITEFKAIPGFGVYSKIGTDEFFIGNKQLMLDNSIIIITNKAKTTFTLNGAKIVPIRKFIINNSQDELSLEKEGNSVLFIAKNNSLISLIGVRDVLKENVKDTILKLKEKNIEIVMLTGDNEETANFIGKEIGIDHVIANVKPNEKAIKIESLKQNGLVAMCGDGINDSVSLVTSDIGISISNGTDIAIDSAQVVLMNDDLSKLNDLIYISKKTIRNIKQNLFWAFFYNFLMIPVAAGVFSFAGITLNPMIASFAMTISSLTVVLNALRLRKIK